MECSQEIQDSFGTEEYPLCKSCNEKIIEYHAFKNQEDNGIQNIETIVPIKKDSKKSSFVAVFIILILVVSSYFTFGFFVIQPIGAIPEGGTILYLRLGTAMPFISSADGLLDEKVGDVSLLGRGLALGIAAKILEKRKIFPLPYMPFLYQISTKGKTFDSSPDLTSPIQNSFDSNDKRISPSDFKIISHRGVWEDGYLMLKGEIRNDGNIPGGPEVEVIARDVAGILIDSKKFWPNSITNIPPGGTCGIEYYITEDKRAKSYEVKVIDVKIWN
jgi:hypothetical protein